MKIIRSIKCEEVGRVAINFENNLRKTTIIALMRLWNRIGSRIQLGYLYTGRQRFLVVSKIVKTWTIRRAVQ